VRGVRQALEVLERLHPAYHAQWTQWRALAQQFDMDGLARALLPYTAHVPTSALTQNKGAPV
jgi:hypothetical protein